MRILLAFDKFKDALSAPRAIEVTATALRALYPDCELDACPLTDGGEGFAAVLTAAAGGEERTVEVTGPRGTPVRATYGLVAQAKLSPAVLTQLALPPPRSADERLAVLDMASASGLALLAPADRDPWLTSTRGTGELLRAAAGDHAVAGLLLGVGGSATNDLGLGALAALGVHALTADAMPLAAVAPQCWSRIARFSGAVPASLPPIRIACDVANPLLGPQGCAAIYGPQKGLRAADLPQLEAASARIARMLAAHRPATGVSADTPGAGAAGGLAFGLMLGAGAQLLPGFSLVSTWLDLDRRIHAADIVITGEGRFDASSLAGKAPGAIARRALALGKRVHLFAGTVALTAADWPDGLSAHPVTPAGTALPLALANAAPWLHAAVRRAAAAENFSAR